MKQKGFSLMEVVLVMGIIGVVGFVTSNLLTRTYRSSSDADAISTLKRNGEIASTGLGEAIRMADGVVCYGSSNGVRNDRIVIRSVSGTYTLFRFVDPVGGASPQNGYIAKQENKDPAGLSTFCTSPPVTSKEVSITDRDGNSGVSISNGDFKGIPGPSGKDTVTIIFEVGAPVSQTNINKVNIQTTVQVR
jgi:prepilin-type N-terminal cleavage/methylation domain-containing protein